LARRVLFNFPSPNKKASSFSWEWYPAVPNEGHAQSAFNAALAHAPDNSGAIAAAAQHGPDLLKGSVTCSRFPPSHGLGMRGTRMTAFQRTCVPEEWQDLTLSKLRHGLFWLPAELTRPQNRPTLWLDRTPTIEKWSDKILHRIHKLKPLGQ